MGLSNWVPADDVTSNQSDSASAAVTGEAGDACPGNVLSGLPVLGHDRQQQRKEERPSQPPPRPRSWRRKAELTYAISSPFGSSDATVMQEHTLLDQQETGEVFYSEHDCITGFPMVVGDLSVKTTFLVTPADDGDPERVRVRVGVVVEEIELPRRLRFLNKRVGKIVGNGGRKQAEKWLGEMIKAGPPTAEEA